MAIPQGKAITMKIKAKAKMLTETKEVTNTITAEGYWIRKKQASVNTKINATVSHKRQTLETR